MAVGTKGNVGTKNGPAPKTAPAPAKAPAVATPAAKPKPVSKYNVDGVPIDESKLYKDAQFFRELIGYQTESEFAAEELEGLSPELAEKKNVKLTVYAYKNFAGEPVRLRNNAGNRPIKDDQLLKLRQKALNHQLDTFNFENIVVGENGTVLSGQHFCAGVIEAQNVLDYEGDDENGIAMRDHYRKLWPSGKIVVPKTIGYGLAETNETKASLNDGVQITISDALFSDLTRFANNSADNRLALCKLEEEAIKLVWARTGLHDDAMAPAKTVKSALDFDVSHPKIIAAVSHIFSEIGRRDAEGKSTSVLRSYMSPGLASGLLFLMGAADSDKERWDAAVVKDDSLLNFEQWDKAISFWTGVGDPKNPMFDGVRAAINACGSALSIAPMKVRIALLVNAWNQYISGGDMGISGVMPAGMFGDPDKRGNKVLKVMPSVGGIDVGDPRAVARAEKEAAEREAEALKEALDEEAGELAEQAEDPTPEEIAEIERLKVEEKKKGLQKKGLRGGTAR